MYNSIDLLVLWFARYISKLAINNNNVSNFQWEKYHSSEWYLWNKVQCTKIILCKLNM